MGNFSHVNFRYAIIIEPNDRVIHNGSVRNSNKQNKIEAAILSRSGRKQQISSINLYIVQIVRGRFCFVSNSSRVSMPTRRHITPNNRRSTPFGKSACNQTIKTTFTRDGYKKNEICLQYMRSTAVLHWHHPAAEKRYKYTY